MVPSERRLKNADTGTIGGVATQKTQKGPSSNPAKIDSFLGLHGNAIVKIYFICIVLYLVETSTYPLWDLHFVAL
jgi:hypothetical protein